MKRVILSYVMQVSVPVRPLFPKSGYMLRFQLAELLLTLLSTKKTPQNSPLNLILKATDDTAAGSTDVYLSSPLRYTTDERGQEICMLKLPNNEEVGVMMGWEHGI